MRLYVVGPGVQVTLLAPDRVEECEQAAGGQGHLFTADDLVTDHERLKPGWLAFRLADGFGKYSGGWLFVAETDVEQR